MLGRPFGVPNNAGFQERVLIAALKLLEAPSGPVLVDYPEDAPPTESASDGVACPVSFVQDTGNDLASLFIREVEELQPWNDRARERRGRSLVGLSRLPVVDAARLIKRYLASGMVDSIDGYNAGETLKLVCEDIRTYYYEAASARPGAPDAEAIQRWFWNQTAGGRVFLELHKHCLASKDASLQKLCATSLVPRAVFIEMEVRK